MNINDIRKIVLAVAFWSVAAACFALTGFDSDYDAARARAKAGGKPVFVLFTGSDWCPYCVKLEKEVLSQSEFLAAATNEYELVVLDFPQKKQLPEEQKKRNRKLMKKFEVEGFPTVLLIDADENVLHEAGYERGGAAKWIKNFKKGVKLAPLRKKHIAPLEDELEELVSAAGERIMKGMAEEDARKKTANAKAAGAEFLPKAKALRAKAAGAAMPPELEDDRKEMLRNLDGLIQELKEMAELDVEKKAAEIEEEKKSREERRRKAEEKRERNRPRLVLPDKADAKFETDYWKNVAMPFYRKHIVDTFVPPKGMSPKDAEKVRTVRYALARYLATGREEFPTGAEKRAAHELWRAKCRDAAVAVVHYTGLSGDDRYWQGPGIFRDAVAKHDFKRETVLGYILRSFAVKSAHYRVERVKEEPKKPLLDAVAEQEKAFGPVKDVFKAADRRILERFSEIRALPDKAEKEFGDEYLALCQDAAVFMDKASDARGAGWASSVTEEGWNGWEKYNSMAATNLLKAVKLRPLDARAPMMLSSLAGRFGGVEGSTFSWCNMAISNSLDRSAETIERFLHFQTSRWGGSTRFLMGVVMDCATNVDVRSTFSYRAAAAALQKVLQAELEGEKQEGAFKKVVTDDVAAALYGMFEAYAAAPETEFMPRADIFRAMGLGLALQLRDWKAARRWWKSIKGPLDGEADAYWLEKTYSPADEGIFLTYMFRVLAGSGRAEDFLKAEEAAADGRTEEAYKIYSSLQNLKNPGEAEKYLAGNRFFQLRLDVQRKAGGWIDLMPTRSGGEANHWWDMTATCHDGKARINGGRGRKGYYRLTTALPGIGAEYEGTVHFERKDPKQKTWNIGWGLARIYSGYCAENSSWAYPYIAFSRDEKGDHYAIETFTEGKDGRKDAPKAFAEIGRYPDLEVAKGDLETRDSHDFKLSATGGKLKISIDGKPVWECTIDEMLGNSKMRDRIQPDGSVLPVWKIFRNTAFSGYRCKVVEARPE